jgi:hypothetical protein
MNIWAKTQEILSNREIALIFWIASIVFALLLSRERKSIVPIIEILTGKIFLIIFSLIGIYLLGIFALLSQFEFWQISNLKDVLFWFFSVGLILVFKINDAKSSAYFKEIFFSVIKWTIFLEFVINLYSFNLIVEIIILPVLAFSAMAQVIAKRDEKQKTVLKPLGNFLAFAGISIFTYSLYKTILNINNLITLESLLTLLLPSTLTILFLPFVYFLALFSSYQSYFVHLDNMTVKKDKVKRVKRLILWVANINLDKLQRIKKNFRKGVFYDDTDLTEYIHLISRKQR